ncbi:Protein of unknown function [Nonlabens sp. Hel1_33_55]|uniref:DUF421 domain-containing protein n=1 Tax=Nonlabens sp. Hel1_33_55 TaxID=1336802 RepID=UPI000875D554|nr:YetF domain-containing protein [Nonlabens sp. Hel1_33_55]SCY41222.1 Protein of unknown function [Nonlabens sp. Hel1_33_55]
MNEAFSFDITNVIGILVSSVIIYVIVILYLRVMGKRSTSELNGFDWIVTVSIGSIFASTVLLDNISVFEGAINILVLLILQFITTKLVYRFKGLRGIVKSNPHLLLYKGKFIDENLKKERILKSEIYAEVRQKGFKSIKQIYAIVLETNSKISVIADDDDESIGFSLSDVMGLPDGLKDDLQEHSEGETNG